MAKNLLSIKDLSKDEIVDLISFARNFINTDGSIKKEELFSDKTIANIFCEPSTRTKSSFEIAAKNLGCTVVDFDVSSSSIKKGESIYETIDALSLMGVNLSVLRHPESVIRELAEYIPEMVFINAGEGSISHPTQTLIDFMTIMDFKDSMDDLKILIVGDLDHSRVTSSFVEGLEKFPSCELIFCGHPSLCTHYASHSSGYFESNLDNAIKDVDVVMSLRIQYERFEDELQLDLDEYSRAYQITSERLEAARGDAIIMHPGPVNYVEISENAYQSENSVIRKQVNNSVPIRMSVLSRFLSS